MQSRLPCCSYKLVVVFRLGSNRSRLRSVAHRFCGKYVSTDGAGSSGVYSPPSVVQARTALLSSALAEALLASAAAFLGALALVLESSVIVRCVPYGCAFFICVVSMRGDRCYENGFVEANLGRRRWMEHDE